MRGRVAAARVGRAHFLRAADVFANQPVDDRALPYPGRSEQRRRTPRREMPPHVIEPFSRFRIDHVYDDISRQRRHVVELRGQIGREVRLGEDDGRRRAALARHQQVALEPAMVVVTIEPHHDEHHVHVGGDHLLAGRFAGRAAREGAAARQDFHDDAAIFFGTFAKRDPVADGRQLDAPARTMLQASGGDGVDLPAVDVDAKNLVELDRDASGLDVDLRFPRLVRGGKPIAPSKLAERHRCLTMRSTADGSVGRSASA